ENVLLANGIALVADFGVARPGGRGGSSLTTAHTTVGTPAYTSPEQLMGSPDVDARSDVYSLACLVYEMLAGNTPFVGPAESLAYQHLSAMPRPVSDVR